MLGLRFCARAFSSCGGRGPLFIAGRGPLTVAASPVAEHRLQMRRLSNCGSGAQPLRGMWDLPGPGHDPVYPALAGGFPTTAPPGKPWTLSLTVCFPYCKLYKKQSNVVKRSLGWKPGELGQPCLDHCHSMLPWTGCSPLCLEGQYSFSGCVNSWRGKHSAEGGRQLKKRRVYYSEDHGHSVKKFGWISNQWVGNFL